GRLAVAVFPGQARPGLSPQSARAPDTLRCVASSKALRDHALRSSRDCGFLSARNLDRFAIADQCEFSVLVHGIKIEELLCHRWPAFARLRRGGRMASVIS